MIGTLRKEYAYVPMKTSDTERWVWLREVYRTEQIVHSTMEPGAIIMFQVGVFEHLGNAIKSRRTFEDVQYGMHQEQLNEVF